MDLGHETVKAQGGTISPPGLANSLCLCFVAFQGLMVPICHVYLAARGAAALDPAALMPFGGALSVWHCTYEDKPFSTEDQKACKTGSSSSNTHSRCLPSFCTDALAQINGFTPSGADVPVDCPQCLSPPPCPQ